jgi:S1-C subfamily serine protease/DNA-binding beta-propeller fold protein YncE
MLLAVLIAIDVTLSSAVEFAPLKLREIPTGMAIAENGEFLFVAHQQANAVSVHNIVTGTTVAYVSCQAPKSMIYRGRKLFVANFGKGTVSVMSADKNWELTDELLVGNPNVYFLSAPCEGKFDGTILVTAGKYADHSVFALDTKTDKNRQVRKEIYISVASFSADGSTIIQQGELTHSPSAVVESFDAKAYLSGERAMSSRGEHQGTPILHPLAHSSFWFGTRSLYAGTPPKRFGVDMGSLLIPDSTRACFYVVGTNAITVHKLDPNTQELKQVPLAAPLPVGRWSQETWPDNTIHFPAAATHSNTTALFAYIPGKQSIFTCAFPAAPDKAIAVGRADGGTASSPPAGTLPTRVIVGKPVTVRLAEGSSTGRYEVVSGPAGVMISTFGVLTWTPTAGDAGAQSLKVRCNVGGNVSFLRLSTEVVAADLAAKVSGDLTKLDQLGTHILTTEKYDLQVGAGEKSLLLLADRTLNVLDEDGLVVTRTVTLDSDCTAIRERANWYVGLGKKDLVLVDKKTGKTVRSIELPGTALDLAIHPSAPYSFVACQLSVEEGVSSLTGRRLLLVDEDKGRVFPLERAFGQRIAIDPSGRYLYAALKDMVDRGLEYNAWMGVVPSYQDIDVLLCYEIGANGLSLLNANTSPGANGRVLRLAPDGKNVSHVAGGGYRSGPEGTRGYTVPAFPAGDVSAARIAYDIGAYPVDIAYHPCLDMVAVCNENEIRLFERASGRILSDRLNLKELQLSNIRRLLFSPGGRHLLVESNEKSGKRGWRSLPLVLTASEVSQVRQPRTRPVAAATAWEAFRGVASGLSRKAVKVADFDALQAPGASAKTTREIALANMNAVVIIKSENSSGTGFLIGRKGYILTCAHVIPLLGVIHVSYRQTERDKVGTVEVKAALVATDEKNDLALLKIETADSLPTVKFGGIAPPETGEAVSVIGHPGVGSSILDYTMTQGIVSTPKREIKGMAYVQTSAAVNPGTSGAPMFDTKGNVIGVVTLKASIEGAGFAVPMSRILPFLKSVTE